MSRVLMLPHTDEVASPEPFVPISFDPDLVPAYHISPGFDTESSSLPFTTNQPRDPGLFSIHFERETDLIDGGFGRAPESDDTAVSHFESQGERFDSYSLSFEWNPAGPDATVQWLLIGGIHAIRANIGKLDPDNAALGLTEARGMVAIPTVGTGLRWSPTDAVSFSTTAATQSIERDASMLEIVFSAELRVTPLVDLTAGYEFYRSDLTVEDLQTSLNREGVFAKLTIRF